MRSPLFTRVSPTVSSLLALGFLFAAFLAQVAYDAVWKAHYKPHAPVHKFVLPAPIIRHFAFGFENILADYYWVTAIQDFNKWDRFDTYYPEYFRIISALDPKFEYPYVFAALTVPSKKNPNASLEWLSSIEDVGMAALPTDWEIPYYTGTQYHFIEKSYERAAHYLGIAAAASGSPPIAKEVYGIYLLHSTSDYQRSRALLSAILETTNNQSTKDMVKEQIALLDLIEAVDEASTAFKVTHHVFPVSLEELERGGYINLPSEILKHYPIEINPETGKAKLE